MLCTSYYIKIDKIKKYFCGTSRKPKETNPCVLKNIFQDVGLDEMIYNDTILLTIISTTN